MTATIDAMQATQAIQSTDLMDAVRQMTQTEQAMTAGGVGASGGTSSVSQTEESSFGDMLSGLIKSVNDKNNVAQVEAQKVMTGESTSIHQAVLSMREAQSSFTMMAEVRNKLVSAYQELMRMNA
jgi:flagellar hook-basal body complex protein FliE